jgi:flagellar basal-body rod modification protein FlgD
MDITSLGLRAAEAGAAKAQRQSLGQDDFLTLLTTQLKNQDPLSPMDNEAFVAQLAQFSTVSGITEMNKSLSTLAQLAGSDARAAAPQWLGRDVTGTSGEVGTVSEVGFAADGSLLLTLDSGARLGIASIAAITKGAST